MKFPEIFASPERIGPYYDTYTSDFKSISYAIDILCIRGLHTPLDYFVSYFFVIDDERQNH